MGMPTLNKFCCCCELEMGGIIIGWINAIVSFVFIIMFSIMVFTGVMALFIARNSEQLGVAISLVVVGCIYILYFLIYFVAGVFLISAVRHREHHRMRLILILMFIGVVLSFASIATSTWGGLAGALIYSAFTCYFFLCIYSLYKKFKNESRGGAVHFEPTPYGA